MAENKLKKKYLLFHNGDDDNYCIIEDIESLKKNITIVLNLISLSSENGYPNRLSIYELEEESELNWYNINGDTFLLVNKEVVNNKWEDRRGLSFAGDYYSIEEIFDEKYEFENDYSYYIGKELFFSYFNESDIKTSGVYSVKKIFGEGFLSDLFKLWKTSIKYALDDVVKRIERDDANKTLVKITIPFNVSEDVNNDNTKVVGITITDEGIKQYTSMDKDKCMDYIRKNYPHIRERYHKDKWTKAFSIFDENDNYIKVK
jgi:hypothetical protein